MSGFRKLPRRFRFPWRSREQIHAEVDEELAFHLEMRAKELAQQGMSREAAQAQAEREFGSVEEARMALRWADERSERHRRRNEWLEAACADLRYGWRHLRRSPGFATVAVLTLALGIGANTAIFSVVHSVLLRPLPYAEPDRLVSVRAGMGVGGEFLMLREYVRAFSGVAAFNAHNELSLTGHGEPLRLESTAVSAELFPLLGAGAELGRTFVVEEDRPGQDRVVLLSHALWRQHFGADPGIIGKVIRLNGVARTVVGVMPAGLGFPNRGTQVWIPAALDPANRSELWGNGGYRVVARLRPGVTREQARTEVAALEPRLREQIPWAMAADYWQEVAITPLKEQIVGEVRPVLLMLLGAVGFVLLLACVNIANLLLARAAERRREIAVRSALGAARGRIVRQLLTESLLLAFLGGSVGLLLGFGGAEMLRERLPAETPRLGEITVSAEVLAFALALTLLTGLLFGSLPALRAAASELQAALREGGRGGGGRRRRLSGALAAAEVALAVVLVIGAGLLIRSFWHLMRVDAGFRSDDVISATVSPPEFRYGDAPARRELYRALLERLEVLPGVQSAAVSDRLPFGGRNYGAVFAIDGRVDPAEERGDWPYWADVRAVVSEEYLRTLGIPLQKGRAFTEADREGAPAVTLVSESLARQYWPDSDAVGQRIRFPGDPEWRTVVGVVGDLKWDRLDEERKGAIYLPLRQGEIAGTMAVVARATGDPAAVAAALRATVRSLDGDTPIDDLRTVRELIARSLEQPRFAAVLLSLFGAVALLLGAVGVYGVISHAVSQRTREIGVRMALGAGRGEVLWMVLRQGGLLAAAGAVLGLGAAALLTRALRGLIFGIAPTDVVTFASVPLLLVAIALLASYLPARRATRVDPMMVLRAE